MRRNKQLPHPASLIMASLISATLFMTGVSMAQQETAAPPPTSASSTEAQKAAPAEEAPQGSSQPESEKGGTDEKVQDDETIETAETGSEEQGKESAEPSTVETGEATLTEPETAPEEEQRLATPVAAPSYAENSQTEPAVEKKKSPFVLGLLWDMSVPIGSTHQFTPKITAKGFTVDGRYHGFGNVGVGNIGVGLSLAWHTMDSRTETSVKWKNATISGTQIREISSTPFTAKAWYALRDLEGIHPYAGMGFGAARIVRRVDMGISRVVDETWHVALVPEIGVEIPLKVAVLLASSRFNYFFKTDNGPKQMYFNFSVGLGFD